MGRSRIGWAVGVVAPWCLGFGVAVSFSADAGQPAAIGASVATLTLAAAAMPDDLVPRTEAVLTGDLGAMLAHGGARLETARFDVGPKEAFHLFNDEAEPRADLKRSAGASPLNGMCVVLMPAIFSKASGARLVRMEAPGEPRLTLPGFAFA